MGDEVCTCRRVDPEQFGKMVRQFHSNFSNLLLCKGCRARRREYLETWRLRHQQICTVAGHTAIHIQQEA